MRRRLREDALKPGVPSWIFIPDPDFGVKAQRVGRPLDRTWDGARWSADDYVLSADEKTTVQARCRCHRTLAAGQARAIRVNHEYGRGGALAYLAAYDVHRATVFGRCETTTGIAPFMNLVTQVMTREPYASADRVYSLVDNGSSHRGRGPIARLADQDPNAIMVHTPVHASWPNQIEIDFSIVQRKVLSPNDFPDLDPGSDRLSAFENRYNATAQPFTWSSPPPTWPNCWPGSTTTHPSPTTTPPNPVPHHPRRTYKEPT